MQAATPCLVRSLRLVSLGMHSTALQTVLDQVQISVIHNKCGSQHSVYIFNLRLIRISLCCSVWLNCLTKSFTTPDGPREVFLAGAGPTFTFLSLSVSQGHSSDAFWIFFHLPRSLLGRISVLSPSPEA